MSKKKKIVHLHHIYNNMITALQAASYICQRYYQDYGDIIDEMKLHKLLYFAQREAIIFNNEPLFNEQFVAWKYGPVMLCVRKAYNAYKQGQFNDVILSDSDLERFENIFDAVFKRYANKTSWSLSTLTHGEFSWQNARRGLSSDVNGNNMMSIEDIRKDAERIKLRRVLFE